MRLTLSLLALPLAMAALTHANTASAAEGDDRFALRLGAMNIDSDNTIRGKTNVAGFLVGQIMKASSGKADPTLVKELLQHKLSSP